MKTFQVIAVATLALAHRAAGATCDESDAKKILALMGEVLKNENCLASTNSECPNAKCAPTIVKVTNQLPDCSAKGENPKQSFEDLLEKCKIAGAESSATAPFSTVSSAGVALSSAAVTIAIMYM